MNKIGIIGGSFDPVHCGHLILAEQVRVEIGLSKVIFMPAYVSPFKQNTKAADAVDRLEMVVLATKGNPYFEVSSMEISRKRVSYTAETLRQCAKNFGKDTEIWFITGSDAFLGMEKWRESVYLFSHFSFAIGVRPGFPEGELDGLIQRLSQKYKTRIKKIRTPQIDISASLIRDLTAVGKSVRYLVPDSVLDYMEKKELYDVKTTIKTLPYEGIKSAIRQYMARNLKESRRRHTEGVVETAVALAKHYGADPEKAELCALFHDCRREEGNLLHGPMAAKWMEQEFHIHDADMLRAVEYHTTGRADMSLLEKVIYVADAMEPTRDYPGVDTLRNLAIKDLNSACLFAMEHSIQYVREQGLVLDENTVNARNFLEKETI